MRPLRMAFALLLSLVLVPFCPRLASCEEPKSAAPPNMTVVYMALLKKGPSCTAQQTAETRAVQEAHMANIRALWEGKALAATDPAVKAGRLAVEIHPWWVEKRALPESGPYCQGEK